MSHNLDTRLERREAIVLGSRKLRDKAGILLCLAKDYGRLDCVIRSSRKSIEPFTIIDGSFYRRPKSELWTLREWETVRPAPKITDWKRATVLAAAAEVLVHSAPLERMDAEVYPVIAAFVEIVPDALSPLAPLFAFLTVWSPYAGFGSIVARSESGRRFIARAVSDHPQTWKRYKLSATVERELINLFRDHIERALDRRWTGIRTLSS